MSKSSLARLEKIDWGTHNPLVVGSSPTRPTNKLVINQQVTVKIVAQKAAIFFELPTNFQQRYCSQVD